MQINIGKATYTITSRIFEEDFINPIAHLAIITPPKSPIIGSRKTSPKYLPINSAPIARIEVKASARMCKYAAL